jgi:hypothetical protein
MNYEKILRKSVGFEKIEYGILFGNKKIVFIKVGAGGNIRGYQDKYLKMAHRVHERIGATVICSSNPDASIEKHLDVDKALIKKVISDLGLSAFELYFVGTSDGGEHSLKLSQQFPETVKFLGLNSSWSSIEDFIELTKSMPHTKKTFVYGALDDDFDDGVPRLKALGCDNLEIIILDGVDHNFTDKVDDFIALIDLI